MQGQLGMLGRCWCVCRERTKVQRQQLSLCMNSVMADRGSARGIQHRCDEIEDRESTTEVGAHREEDGGEVGGQPEGRRQRRVEEDVVEEDGPERLRSDSCSCRAA